MSAEPSAIAVQARPKAARSWIMGWIVFVLALDLAFFWQRVGGADRSEFGGHPDEAAHYVTGLFVHDAAVMAWRYAAGGFGGSPIRVGKDFADTYYAHYPKVSLGVWPPFFYIVQAAWTLPLSPSRTSVLLLMCALAAVVAVQLFRVLRAEFSVWLAAFGATLWLSLPLVRSHYGMIMAETLSTALMFGAVLALGDFLDREKRGDALRFGVFAALAILTKGTGLALALAAPLALLFTRRWHLLKRPALWLAVMIVAVLAGPWTWATRHLGKGGWAEPSPSWHFTREALPYYAGKFGLSLGILVVLLFCLGAWAKYRTASGNPGRWAAAGAFIISVIIFQSIAPVGLEARHLLPALPAAVMFVIAGVAAIGQRVSSVEVGTPASSAATSPWPLILVLAGLCSAIFPLEKKGFAGFAPLAEAMLADATPVDVALVSSDARGEGMFISEIAMREHRPGHVIQRASKALASSTWSGSGYSPLFKDDDGVLSFLTSGKIQYLVLDDAVPEDKRRAHQDQLKRVLEDHPESFALIATAEITRAGESQLAPLRLYKIQRKN